MSVAVCPSRSRSRRSVSCPGPLRRGSSIVAPPLSVIISQNPAAMPPFGSMTGTSLSRTGARPETGAVRTRPNTDSPEHNRFWSQPGLRFCKAIRHRWECRKGDVYQSPPGYSRATISPAKLVPISRDATPSKLAAVWPASAKVGRVPRLTWRRRRWPATRSGTSSRV
jgi:hypothetical protein